MFEIFICVAMGLGAFYLISCAFVVHTSNLGYSLFFKVIPFFIGVLLVFLFFERTGAIKLVV